MIMLSCLSGAVHLEIDQRPDFIHACNCTLCSKTGARWGYFDPSAVHVTGATSHYCRQDKPDAAALVQFCGTCGATTHFVLTPDTAAKFGNTMMGVNMWLADPCDLVGIELRFPDGRAWAGSGDFGYVEGPRFIGQAGPED